MSRLSHTDNHINKDSMFPAKNDANQWSIERPCPNVKEIDAMVSSAMHQKPCPNVSNAIAPPQNRMFKFQHIIELKTPSFLRSKSPHVESTPSASLDWASSTNRPA